MITIKPDLIKIKQGDGYVPLLAIKGEQGEQGEPGAVDYGSVYPIGSIYMSVNDTSPASLFGGEWERLEGRFLLGAGELREYSEYGTQIDDYGNKYDAFNYNAGDTGGQSSVTLTANQLPKHTHNVGAFNSGFTMIVNGYQEDTETHPKEETLLLQPANPNCILKPVSLKGRIWANDDYDFRAIPTDYDSGKRGEAHENMPPYQVVYMWKRTA